MTDTVSDSETADQSQQTASASHRTRGTSTIEDPDVHVATRGDYDTAKDVIAALDGQEIRDPLDDANCCAGGDKGFRTYKTDLPVIRREDIVPGQLVYRPTTSPLTVFEFTSKPYVNERGASEVDVTAFSRSHSGEDADIRSQDRSVFVADVVDGMTFLRPETVQETLPI
jgi:hypothetical protein